MGKVKNPKFFRVIHPFLMAFSSIFFQKKYLKGKFFDSNSLGWTWVIKGILWQKILRFNPHIPWPVSPFMRISNPYNIEFDVDNLDIFQQIGNYYQDMYGKIIIGRGTIIGPNVGIITANHDPTNLNRHLPSKDVVLGQKCWIGMNSVILPGVVLGDNTVVGAGSVVTKSFPEGNCVIAGNPAKIIKNSAH